MEGCAELSEDGLYETVPETENGGNEVPGHAAVDGKVEGIRQADDDIDEEDDVTNQLVVKEFNNTEECGVHKTSEMTS